MTDWKLINQAIIGVEWLKEINEASNADKTLRTILKENEERLFLKDERPLNTGVLMMAAYLLFVYPREQELLKLDFTSIDISNFNIVYEDSNNRNPQQLCRRLRNSISHAKFEIQHQKNMIVFHDDDKGKNRIDFEIGSVDFGTFINSFILEVNKQTAKT